MIKNQFRKIKVRVQKIVKFLTAWLKQLPFPANKEVSTYYVLVFFFKALQNDGFKMRASSVAFHFVFALFPLLIFTFLLIPFVPVENLDAIVLSWLENVMPKPTLTFIQGTVKDLLLNKSGSWLSISLITAIYTANRGIFTLTQAFNRTEEERFFKKRTGFKDFILSFGVLLWIALLFLLTLLVFIGGELLLNYASEKIHINDTVSYYSLILLNFFTTFLLIILSISSVYYILPAVKTRFIFFSPGAVFAATLSFLATLGVRYFVVFFNNFNKLYGSLAAMMILMTWFYWISMLIMMGYELNLSISKAKVGKSFSLKGKKLRRSQEKSSQTK